MGNPLVAGRAFAWTDIQQLKPIVVISKNLAREYWEEPSKALGEVAATGWPLRSSAGVLIRDQPVEPDRPSAA